MDSLSDAYNRVQGELMAGEELRWVGKPNPLRAAMATVPLGSIAAVVISIGIGLLAFIMLIPVRSGSSFNVISFTGIMALIIIIAVLASLLNPLLTLLNARNTVYAITSRRIIMLEGRRSSVTSYGQDDIQRIERRLHGDGSTGDIIFRYEPRARSAGSFNSRWSRTFDMPIGFFGIPDVRQVERILLDTFVVEGNAAKTKRKNEDVLQDYDNEDFLAELESRGEPRRSSKRR